MTELSNIESLERLLLALAAGLFLGLERELRAKPAGLRTYALVCEGSALFMMCAILLSNVAKNAGIQNTDPSRIASTVVQGIGFLVAGVILTRGAKIVGLTTAAELWVTAAIGLLFGGGFYFLGIAATITTIIVLGPLHFCEKILEDRFVKRHPEAAKHDPDPPV
jgi:putative Mg2+ transporter-C (MgtC) family protein